MSESIQYKPGMKVRWKSEDSNDWGGYIKMGDTGTILRVKSIGDMVSATIEWDKVITSKSGKPIQQVTNNDVRDIEPVVTVSESTPKSTHERVLRHIRIKDPASGKGKQMAGRITPKKTGNNDPTRGGKKEKRYSKEMEESILFLHNAMTKKITQEEVSNFPQKALLSELVNHLIAVGLGGWREEEDGEGKLRFINESGHVASPNLWKLTKEGKLQSGRNVANWDLDKLFEIREMCNVEEAAEEDE